MHCKLCNSSRTDRVFEKNDVAHFRCSDCQFLFATPEKNANLENELNDFEEAYLTYLQPGPEDHKNFHRILQSLRTFGKLENRRVLDVGAGGGKFVRFLREQGIEAYGLEPATPLFETYLAQDDFFYHGTIEDFLAERDEKFDIVVSSDVLEHVAHPVAFVEGLTRILAPGGVLYLSTCDYSSLTARVLGRRWHFFNRYHLSHFNPQTSTALGERFGLRLASVKHPPRYRSVGYALDYFFTFFLGKGRISPPGITYKMTFPVNLFDIMELYFVRENDGSEISVTGDSVPQPFRRVYSRSA